MIYVKYYGLTNINVSISVEGQIISVSTTIAEIIVYNFVCPMYWRKSH
jgi:hypothetical protein